MLHFPETTENIYTSKMQHVFWLQWILHSLYLSKTKQKPAQNLQTIFLYYIEDHMHKQIHTKSSITMFLHSPLKLIRNLRFSHFQEQPDIIELVWSSFTVAILVFSMVECEMK